MDLTRSEQQRSSPIVTVTDTMLTVREVLTKTNLDSTSLDGPVLRLRVRYGRKRIPQDVSQRYWVDSKEVPGVDTRLYNLRFRLDGSHFVPDAASKKLLRFIAGK